MCLVLSPGCTKPDADGDGDVSAATFESAYFTVEVYGTGPDVILVPGLASNAAVWDGTVAALEADFTLHVVQVSGFGGAPARGNTDNTNILDDLSGAIGDYASTLDAPPAIVGHSLGGLVTLKTALLPDIDLRGIVVVDVLPFFSVMMDEAATAQSMGPISQFMKATLLAQTDDIFALRQREALVALVKTEENLERALSWSVESDRNVMAQAMAEVLVTDLRADISGIDVPAKIIYAKDSSIPNMDQIEAFYQDLYGPLPNGSLRAIPDALHFVMLDQPAAFNEALKEALRR